MFAARIGFPRSGVTYPASGVERQTSIASDQVAVRVMITLRSTNGALMTLYDFIMARGAQRWVFVEKKALLFVE